MIMQVLILKRDCFNDFHPFKQDPSDYLMINYRSWDLQNNWILEPQLVKKMAFLTICLSLLRKMTNYYT